MPYVGINVGAVTVKAVFLDGGRVRARVVCHRGRPAQVLQGVLDGLPAGEFFGVSGHLGHISEVAATQAALEYVGGSFDAVASLGGEAFTVYLLEGRRIRTALSHNRCAAGSGEFLVQQAGRLGLNIEEAIERSFDGKPVRLASRCSVHCKSDIIHKLNRKEASVEDILRSLHESMADKVVSLLAKARPRVGRLLLAGGLCQNRAFLDALTRKLSDTEVMVLPESPYFEALGTAVLTRSKPIHDHPNLGVKPALGVLPALAQYEDRAALMPAATPDRSEAGPFVLGVDAGSTTTKAVLMDARTKRLAAWHYGQTLGDPVEATRRCIRALVAQAGDRSVALVAATGSARELIGAYLGTPNVYNEISAHAVGAAEIDPEVETIFEIGGQDAKYIYLRNGVPVGYAMNASCSAGTGSFLEECAQGDLGLSLAEIAEGALRAAAPVEFTATCAAFINSDIRTALQEGRSRDDVAAGLVYAVVRNYLRKVKGPRPVGTRVFLQGGVALNRAVGCAFAQCVGKQVIIPPRPELLGASGVALLALDRSEHTTDEAVDLADLTVPRMGKLGQFACRGCENLCTIDRFEVAGRRFPFGGRCSRFESGWKRRGKPADVVDLVEARNGLVLAPVVPEGPVRATRGPIGIPRALTAHSLYSLYATFFAGLGFEIVLSEVDPAGGLTSYSGFCFPVQIAHGAVLDLTKRGVNLVFLPHVSRMPNPHAGRDSYLCPVTQASPYFLAKAFPSTTILSPLLDFARGYEACTGLVELAVSRLGIGHGEAEEAYGQAVGAQRQVEADMCALGRRPLTEALEDGECTIILVGRSYNAFPAEASQSVARKLASMNVRVIPGDCLPQQRTGPTAWHYPNIIMNAVALARQHANLFLLHISNFSCTIDAFTYSLLSSELGSKPFLVLEIDSHTADAGVQTRLEAFLDIIENYRAHPAPERPFQATTVGADAVVTISAGQRVSLADPRVRLYFPTFSRYHSRAVSLAARWLGLNVGSPIELGRRQLERGLQHTSGRECLPLPICLGQMLEVHDRRKPGEVVGFYMVRGGAPCVVDCYADYFHRFIRENKLADLFIVDPQEANGYYGLRVRKIAQCLAPALTLADLFVEMEQVLRVVGEAGAREHLQSCWDDCIGCQPSLGALKGTLEASIDRVAAIRHTDPTPRPKVVVTGDFFLRFNPSFMGEVHDLYARRGIIVVPVGLNELLLYGAYAGMASAARDWGLPPDSGRAAALACVRVFQREGKNYLESWAEYRQLRRYDERYRRLFQRTGLLIGKAHDISRLLQQASEHISPVIIGEAIPTVGKGVAAGDEGYDGVIAIGPFNCLPFRISEAILKPYSMQKGMPILAYESDGFSVCPAFLRQVEVHIQQVLANRRRQDGRVVRS